jgi:DNA-binding transcriptional LysR family regulator|tara:strand:- start:5491 stop:6378 length:888 start_codon:yes stop_codon:yes gene_type:complete
MNKFEELEAFVSVVDSHSFSLAADKLGVAKSSLSKRVSELEKRLGVQLMQRTTRRLSLTDSGRHFYQRAVAVLADLDEAEKIVSDAQCGLIGKIKLTAPLGLGVGPLSTPISEFMQLHPSIEIELDINDRELDLVDEGFDLAIRVGDLQDSTLIARKLSRVGFAVCASPAYLKSHGIPEHPSELVGHEVLVYSNVSTSEQWRFEDKGTRVSPKVKSRISANNGEILANFARQGLGVVKGPLFYLQGLIDRGELVPILTDYPMKQAGIYAVYPPGRLVSRRVKMLSDYLLAYFRAC